MSRPNAVTFKGNPMTLAGVELTTGQTAPDFILHFFKDGMQTLKLADLAGKPTLISVVPSLDTGVCAIQTVRKGPAIDRRHLDLRAARPDVHVDWFRRS